MERKALAVTGAVHALVKDRHRSREFIEFLKLLDTAYPAHTVVKLILDKQIIRTSNDSPAHRRGNPVVAGKAAPAVAVVGVRFSQAARTSVSVRAVIGPWLGPALIDRNLAIVDPLFILPFFA